MKLTAAEEQLMQYIWELKTAYTKDIVGKYPQPKPAPTTISTLLKRLNEKGFITYNINGTSRQYTALIKKEDFYAKQSKLFVEETFGGSLPRFLAAFTRNKKLNSKEVEELQKLIDEHRED